MWLYIHIIIADTPFEDHVMNMRMLFTAFMCLAAVSLAAQEEPSYSPNATAGQPLLEKMRTGIQTKLSQLDAEIAAAAAALSATGLDGAEARKILADLLKADPAVIDCCTVNRDGKLVAIEPGTFKQHEGTDISAQSHVKKILELKKPVMSEMFKAVEGMMAIDIEHPVMAKDGTFAGAVSVLFNPGELVGSTAWPLLKDTSLDAWVAQKDGVILFDPDAEEVGLNVLATPAYENQKEVVEFFKVAATREKGQCPFEVRPAGKQKTVFVDGFWTTVKLHETDWKIVVTKALNDDPAAAQRSPEMLGIESADKALRQLAVDGNLKKAMKDNADSDVQKLLKRYFDEHVGLRSAQWVDAKGINRIGYPQEYSLVNYDIATSTVPLGLKIIEVLKTRKETAFDGKLLDGKNGHLLLVPVFDGDAFLGMIYNIKLR